MPRYIDADKLVEKYERAMKDVWNKKTRPLSWNEAYDCVITDIVDEPTAEVVPKSEVEKIIEETFKRVRENFVISPLCKSALSDLEVELKKKYTEEKT